MTRVLCKAIVDPIEDLVSGWRVEVTGQPPHDETRVYSIVAPSDGHAAQEGIRRFVAEMEGN